MEATNDTANPISAVQHIPEDVRALYEQLALDVAAAGFERYSSRAILHRIRWHYHVEYGQRAFKCNNSWSPLLARWFVYLYPEYKDLFVIKYSRDSIEDIL